MVQALNLFLGKLKKQKKNNNNDEVKCAEINKPSNIYKAIKQTAK